MSEEKRKKKEEQKEKKKQAKKERGPAQKVESAEAPRVSGRRQAGRVMIPGIEIKEVDKTKMKDPQKDPACDFSSWVGAEAGEDIVGAIRESGRDYRVLPPGSMMTMDHSPGRINLETDENGLITRVWCG